MLISDLVTRPNLDALPSDVCFIYIPFENEGRLAVPQGVLDGISHEALDHKDFHLTLLMASQCSLEQMTTFLANLSPTMRFFIEVASIDTELGMDLPVLAWRVDPGPQLIRIQSDLYNAAVQEGMEISRFSEPKAFKPHITSAVNLSRRLEEEEIPTIEPFRLEVHEFIIGRSDEEHVFRVSLPRGVVVETIMIERDEKRDIPQDIARDIAQDAITVTRAQMAELLKGHRIVHGPMRRLLSMEDGPFTLRHGSHQGQEGRPGQLGGSQTGFTHTGSPGTKPDRPGIPGHKRKETGFGKEPSGGGKKLFGKAHHQPVEIDKVPDGEDFAELNETLESWEGDAKGIVGDMLFDAGMRQGEDDEFFQVFDDMFSERIQSQMSDWFNNPDAEDFPLTDSELSQMSDAEIQEKMDDLAAEKVPEPTDDEVNERIAQGGTTSPQARTEGSDGEPRTIMFGRDGGEIVTTTQVTTLEKDHYRVAQFTAVAQEYASLMASEQPMHDPNFRPENYENESFDSGFLYMDWLAAKKPRKGYGTSMFGEVVRQAAEQEMGIELEAIDSAMPFYDAMGGNRSFDDTYFWTADQVAKLAERVEDEGITITSRGLVIREDPSEVVFGKDEQTFAGQEVEEEGEGLEPLGGAFTLGNQNWPKRPRPWKHILKDRIEAFELEQEIGGISPEDQAVREERKPYAKRQPDSREQMLMGVQRSLEDMATTIIGSVYQLRHGEHVGQEGTPTGGSQPGYTHVPGSVGGTSVDEGPGREEAGDSERVANMQRMARVLKRITRDKADIQVNPADAEVFASIKADIGNWQPKARGIVDGFLDDANAAADQPILESPSGFSEGEGGTPNELGWNVDRESQEFFDMADETIEGLMESDMNDFNIRFKTAMDDWMNKHGNLADVLEELGVDPEEAVHMSDDEITNQIAEIVSLNALEEEGLINSGEFDSLYEVETDYGNSYSEGEGDPETIASWLAADVYRGWAQESMTMEDIEDHHGYLPYLDPDTDMTHNVASNEYVELYPPEEYDYDEPFESEPGLISYRPDQYIMVGKDDSGVVQAVLSARIDPGTRFRNYDMDKEIELGTHKNLELSEDEFRELQDDRFLHLGYLAARQGGAGHGTEMILRALKIASDNDVGIYGSSVNTPTTVSFYDRLGARWLTENGEKEGGSALFTAEDVQFAVKWMTDAGISLEGAETGAQIEIIEGALTLRFNVWVLGEIPEDEMPTEHFMKMDRDTWADQQSEWHAEYVDQIETLRLSEEPVVREEEDEAVERQEPEEDEPESGPDEPQDGSDEETKFVDFSDVADRWLRENFGELDMLLNPAEITALVRFRADAKDISRQTEGEETLGEEPEMDAALDVVRGLMDRSEVPDNIVVYRGMEVGGQMLTHFDSMEGEVFQATGFTPTSLKTDRAIEFAESIEGDTEGVVLEIEVPAGTKALWMDSPQLVNAGAQEESELLLEEDLKFRIKDTGDNDGQKFMVLEIA